MKPLEAAKEVPGRMAAPETRVRLSAVLRMKLFNARSLLKISLIYQNGNIKDMLRINKLQHITYLKEERLIVFD